LRLRAGVGPSDEAAVEEVAALFETRGVWLRATEVVFLLRGGGSISILVDVSAAFLPSVTPPRAKSSKPSPPTPSQRR
jgi:hypothetical protein